MTNIAIQDIEITDYITLDVDISELNSKLTSFLNTNQLNYV